MCSYNKLRFPPDTNLVFGPVSVPCSGTVAVTSNTGEHRGSRSERGSGLFVLNSVGGASKQAGRGISRNRNLVWG